MLGREAEQVAGPNQGAGPLPCNQDKASERCVPNFNGEKESQRERRERTLNSNSAHTASSVEALNVEALPLWIWSAKQLCFWLLGQEKFADCAAALRYVDGTRIASHTEEELSKLLGPTKGPALFRTVKEKLQKSMPAILMEGRTSAFLTRTPISHKY